MPNPSTLARDDQERQPLTKRQQQVLDMIRTYQSEHGRPPTFREIMDAIGFRSPNAVSIHVQVLKKKGWLTCRNGPRGIVLLDSPGSEAGESSLAHWKARAEKAERMLLEPELIHAEISRCGVQVSMRHWAVRYIAASLLDTLGDAPNYITTEVNHPEKGTVIVTVQRKRGKSPAERIAELEREVESLRGNVHAQS